MALILNVFMLNIYKKSLLFKLNIKNLKIAKDTGIMLVGY